MYNVLKKIVYVYCLFHKVVNFFHASKIHVLS